MNCGRCGAPALQQGSGWVCSQLCGWSGVFLGVVTVVKGWF